MEIAKIKAVAVKYDTRHHDEDPNEPIGAETCWVIEIGNKRYNLQRTCNMDRLREHFERDKRKFYLFYEEFFVGCVYNAIHRVFMADFPDGVDCELALRTVRENTPKLLDMILESQEPEFVFFPEQAKHKFEEIRLTDDELKELTCYFNGSMSCGAEMQALSLDGEIYVTDILNAANFIRKKYPHYFTEFSRFNLG